MVEDDKRAAWLDAMAAHVLECGLAGASLRPLAKAAGTSDRMLIYHFGTKDRLIAALLDHLSAQFTAGLAAALPPVRARSRSDCVREVLSLMRLPQMEGFRRVWLDIVAAGARGDAAHVETGHRILESFVGFLAARVPEGEADAEATARALLVLIEGTVVMDALGHGAMADTAADWLDS